jgi:NhaP-type Na+/H+ or K+/H+ antiporter
MEGGGGLEKGCGFDFVLGCAIVWVEIWILTSVKKMGGVNPGMGKILIFMISCFVWVLGRRKKWCSF